MEHDLLCSNLTMLAPRGQGLGTLELNFPLCAQCPAQGLAQGRPLEMFTNLSDPVCVGQMVQAGSPASGLAIPAKQVNLKVSRTLVNTSVYFLLILMTS
jgi:hypothetical protein